MARVHVEVPKQRRGNVKPGLIMKLHACSGVTIVIVGSGAASAPQSRNLGWTRHILGLVAHIWGPGLLCWDAVKHSFLDCDHICCAGSLLDDR